MDETPRSAPTAESEPVSVWDDPVTAFWAIVPLVLLFAVFALVAAASGHPVRNPDTYFHLRFGAEFWGHWSPWHPGSVTRFATREWLPTQWFGEVLLGRAYAWGGLPAVAWLTGAWVAGYAAALCLVCLRYAHGAIAAGLAMLALVASAPALSGRPQVLSYLLVTVVVGAWIRTRDDGRPRWWLVAVAWVWPLLHGMWLLGLVTSAVAAVAVVVDRRRDLGLRQALHVLAVPVAMALASTLTPLGPRLWGAVAVVGSRRQWFTEWGPPDYHRFTTLVLGVLLALLVVAALRQGSTSWFEIAMIALCAAWAVYSQRTVPVAAATAAPLAAYVLGRRHRPSATGVRLHRWATLGLAATALLVLAVAVPFTASTPRPYPRWVDAELDRLPAGTALLSADYDGSYLMWAHPDLDVVAHGYGDTFTDAELQRNRDLFRVAPPWQATVRRLGVRVALLPDDPSLAHALRVDRHWRVRHDSDHLVYLVAPGRTP